MKEIRQELVKIGFYEVQGKQVWDDYTYLWESGGLRDGKHTICITSKSNCRFIFEIKKHDMEKEMFELLVLTLIVLGCCYIYFVIRAIVNLKRSQRIVKETIKWKKEQEKPKQKKSLGKCNKCIREAIYESYTLGNLCNTCYDRYICGLD